MMRVKLTTRDEAGIVSSVEETGDDYETTHAAAQAKIPAGFREIAIRVDR